MMNNRIEVFINLPLETLDQLSLGKQLDEMGRQPA